MNRENMRRSFTQWAKSHRITWFWHISLSLLVVLAAAFAWWKIGIVYQGQKIAEERERLQTTTDDIASQLTSSVNRHQAQLFGLAANVKTHSLTELRGGHFATFAAGLAADDKVVRAIQYFPPEGKVLLYPKKGNEAVIDSTLETLRNTNRANVRADVQRAIETRKITLSEPYTLIQGNRGIVARLAVYDQDTFLGLTTIVLNLDQLLDVPGLGQGLTETRFTLRDRQGQVFFGEEGGLSENPVQAMIVLPEGYWTLSAIPAKGWTALIRPEMINFWIIGSILILLVGLVAFLVINSQSTLRHAVAERTAQLAASEERYATALRLVDEGIWDWDLNTNTGFASENSYTLLGYPSNNSIPIIEAPIIETFLSHVHPDDLERINEALRSAIENSQDFDIELRVNKQGAWIYILIRGRIVIRDASGAARRLTGTITDITERKQTEARLLEEQSKFRAIFNNDHAPMMLIIPEDGQIIDANPAACAFYGWSSAEITAKKIGEINIMAESEILAEMDQAVREERRFFQFRHRLANGEIRIVEVFSGPIQNNGRTLLYSIIHDMTARKKAEEALAESEERYRQLLMIAPVGIVVAAEGCVQFINPSGARLLGADSADIIIGQSVYKIIPPEQLMRYFPQFEVNNRAEKKSYSVDGELVRLDGNKIDTESLIAPMVYQGKPAYQVIISDTTERKRVQRQVQATQSELQRLLTEADQSRQVLLSVIEDQKIAEEKLNQLNAKLEQHVADRTAQLQAANKELEAFSYSVSHDLRAPLRGIDGWSLALLEDFGPQLDIKGRQYIDRVRSETQRMGDLIDDLLRLARVARLEMNPSRVELSKEVERIATKLKEENPERQVEFIIQPGIYAQGDAHLLEIVLTNLLSNAFKFTSKRTDAQIEFGQAEKDVEKVFFVRDNGAGFDMAFAKNLFGAFQRMHKQTDFPGTGVGLATVQRIINRHGGKVWADAVKNQGAIFYFTLPEIRSANE